MSVFKVVFLDFDGVLNSKEWWDRRPKRPCLEGLHPTMAQWAAYNIDPFAVERLNRIIEATGARTVVSSSWRTMFCLPKLNGYLQAAGFRHLLMGTTPDQWSLEEAMSQVRKFMQSADRRLEENPLADMAKEAQDFSRGLETRGHEITAWLNLLPPELPKRWVCIDDDPIYTHEEVHIHTDPMIGLTDELADKAIAILNADKARR